MDASVVGFKRWAEHQKNFVVLRLAQDRENVLGPAHPDACANPAGCTHHTPCWCVARTTVNTSTTDL